VVLAVTITHLHNFSVVLQFGFNNRILQQEVGVPHVTSIMFLHDSMQTYKWFSSIIARIKQLKHNGAGSVALIAIKPRALCITEIIYTI